MNKKHFFKSHFVGPMRKPRILGCSANETLNPKTLYLDDHKIKHIKYFIIYPTDEAGKTFITRHASI